MHVDALLSGTHRFRRPHRCRHALARQHLERQPVPDQAAPHRQCTETPRSFLHIN